MTRPTGRQLAAAVLATAIVGATSFLGSPADAAKATFSASATLPLRSTDWADTVSLPRFDVSLGELRSVDLRVEAHLEGTVMFENLSDAAATLQATLAATVTLSRPSPGAAITSVQPSRVQSDALDPFDGSPDFTGASGHTESLSDDAANAVSLTSVADLALFTGVGNIVLPTTGTDSSIDPPGPDVASLLQSLVGARVTVTYTYLTDTRPPDAPTIVTSPPAYTADPLLTVTFTAELGATTECRLDTDTPTGSWSTCTSPWQTDLSAEPDGAFTFRVRATDQAGNVGDETTRSFMLDRQAPGAPVLTSTPPLLGQLVHPVWAFTVEPGAVARCSLDGGPTVPCTSPFTTDLTWTPDGPHTLWVSAVDSAGNQGPTVTHTYTLDRVAPVAPTITGDPATPSNDPTPTWTFDLAADAVAASCSINLGPFAACTSPVTANLALSADGDHTISIRNSDAAGNQSLTATRTYRLDRAAPGAPTVGSPASPSNVSNPTWSITAEAGATTECRLDAGAWTACAGSFTTVFGSGSDGVHTLTVRATDTAGNLGPEAIASYLLDTMAPAAPVITAAPADPSNSPTPIWTFTVEAASTPSCSVDGAPWAPCASPFQVDLSTAADGPHSLAVRATDGVGNVGTATTSTFVLDRSAPPAPTITSAPASPGNQSTVTWTFLAPEGTSTRCRLDMGAVVPCDGSFTTTLTTDGLHRLGIAALDSAGNLSSFVMATYVLDRVAPVVPTIDSVPVSPARLTTPQWTFTLEAQSIGWCSLDELAWVPCTTSFSADLSDAGDGVHSFRVRSIDAAGNIGETAFGSYELDRTAPGLPVIIETPAADSADDTPTWTFTFDDDAVAECRIDDGAWVPCGGSYTADLTSEADGTHSLEVRAVDAVGNVGPTAVSVYSLDRIDPAAAVFTATPLSPGNDPLAVWTFTFEPGTTAWCSADGADPVVCDGTFAIDLVADGPHDLVVTISDAAGNWSEAGTSTYLLDTVAPKVPVLTAPETPGRDTQPEWAVEVELGSVAECSLDGGPAAACGAVFTADLAGDDGTHRLIVIARDAAGNASLPASSTYVLDTVAPAAPAIQHTPDRSAWTWRFALETQTTAECSIDSGPWTACASPLPGGTPGRTVRFEVRALDRAGNRSDVTGTTVTPTMGTGPTAPPTNPGGPSLNPPTTETPGALAPVGGGASGPFAPTRVIVPGPGDPVEVDANALLRRFRPEDSGPFAGPVAQLLQAVGEKTTIPVLVVLIVIGFVAVQNRIDRRDPKLAEAPLRHEPEYLEFK